MHYRWRCSGWMSSDRCDGGVGVGGPMGILMVVDVFKWKDASI